eukprot:TRINITY_DN63322_c0_g1_i1.p1 TRINITY_DN63322_c0_g1~~TRINITY_DN63322_c0_g1_i1.p1  ORF type:complete len:137 (+),score=4.29 TRINITY_DN63322_c0_g1_i1:722-1132(+)
MSRCGALRFPEPVRSLLGCEVEPLLSPECYGLITAPHRRGGYYFSSLLVECLSQVRTRELVTPEEYSSLSIHWWSGFVLPEPESGVGSIPPSSRLVNELVPSQQRLRQLYWLNIMTHALMMCLVLYLDCLNEPRLF